MSQEYEELNTSLKKESAKSAVVRGSSTIDVPHNIVSITHVGNYLPNISSGINIQSSNQKQQNKLRNSMINSPATTTTGVDKNSQELATSIMRSASGVVNQK
jgi:hypothetical protein